MSTDISTYNSSRPKYSFRSQHAGERQSGSASYRAVSEIGLVWFMRLLAACAVSGSAYLAWAAYSSGKVAGCGSGSTFDCSHVLNSRWATFLGVPVSVFAIFVYGTILTLMFAPAASAAMATLKTRLISFAAFLAGLGAIWFIGLQVLWIRHLCSYCLVVHACGLAMAGLVAWKAPAGRAATNRLMGLAVLPVALFIAGQIFFAAPERFELIEHRTTPTHSAPGMTVESSEEAADGSEIFESPLIDQSSVRPQLPLDFGSLLHPISLLTSQVTYRPEEQSTTRTGGTERRTATILNGIKLDVSQWPLLGKPDAPYVFAEMLDYTCVHCQNTHGAIHGAMEKFGDQLAVIILPVPMNAQCNPQVKTMRAEHAESCRLAELAIAVWILKPQAFGDFHSWLLEAKPTYSQAWSRGVEVAGDEGLRRELASRLPADYITKNVELYARASAGSIPKILFPTTSAVGEMRSPSTLIGLIERELVRPAPPR